MLDSSSDDGVEEELCRYFKAIEFGVSDRGQYSPTSPRAKFQLQQISANAELIEPEFSQFVDITTPEVAPDALLSPAGCKFYDYYQSTLKHYINNHSSLETIEELPEVEKCKSTSMLTDLDAAAPIHHA